MDKIAVTKFVVKTIVGFGASKVVGQIIANNTNPETVKDKVLIVAGAAAIGGMVSDAAQKYTDKAIDELVEAYETHVKPRIQK